MSGEEFPVTPEEDQLWDELNASGRVRDAGSTAGLDGARRAEMRSRHWNDSAASPEASQ